MAVQVVMPSLGMYTTEGRISEYCAAPGSRVTAGQAIVAVETEKTTNEVEAPADGIWHPIAKLGSVLSDQALIGYILAEGEALPGATPETAPASSAAPVAAESTQAPVYQPVTGIIKSSPAARALARDLGVDMSTVIGTGNGGRITEDDVRAAAGQ